MSDGELNVSVLSESENNAIVKLLSFQTWSVRSREQLTRFIIVWLKKKRERSDRISSINHEKGA